jgi:hypothetical protein
MNGGNGFDGAAAVVSVGLGLTVGEQQGGGDVGVDMTNVQVKSKFRQFLKSKEDSDGAFSYREQLLTNYEQGSFHLSVDMDDIRGFDQALLTVLRDDPSKYMPVFEQAAKEVVGELNLKQGENADALKDIQILLSNFPRLISLRGLSAEHVSNLVTVRGIVVSAGKVSVKATSLTIICGNCNATKQIPCHSGFGGARMPRRCDTPYTPNSGLTKCPLDPYRILADASEYVDMQLLKVQEFPEDVPTGEMPRHLKASAERYLVGTVKPGSRVTLVGIYSTYESRDKRSAAATSRKDGVRDIGIRIPYLRVLGISNEADNVEFLQGKFNPEEVSARACVYVYVCVCVLLDFMPLYYGYSQCVLTPSPTHTHTHTHTHTGRGNLGDEQDGEHLRSDQQQHRACHLRSRGHQEVYLLHAVWGGTQAPAGRHATPGRYQHPHARGPLGREVAVPQVRDAGRPDRSVY